MCLLSCLENICIKSGSCSSLFAWLLRIKNRQVQYRHHYGNTHFLKKYHVHLLLENYWQKPFGLIRNEAHFDLTEVLPSGEYTHWYEVKKLVYVLGKISRFWILKLFPSCHGTVGLEQELVCIKLHHFATWKNLSKKLIHFNPRELKI